MRARIEGKAGAVLAMARAFEFSTQKHKAQKRKGADQEPYVNHLAEVARLVAEATGGRNLPLVLAALLHDTLEDTDTTRGELRREFGPQVARLVAEVTVDKTLPKPAQKMSEERHAHRLSRGAKILKIADKTSNLRSVAISPPVTWSTSRRRDYVAFTERVVSGCRGVSPQLEAAFAGAQRAARRSFRTARS